MIALLSLCLYPIRGLLTSPSADISSRQQDDSRFSPEQYYGIHAASAKSDTSLTISLVDIGDLSGPDAHRQIATVIDRIRRFRPRMIGVDVVFDAPSGNATDEELLRTVAKGRDSTVYVRELQQPAEGVSDGYLTSHNSYFTRQTAVREGFSNLCNRRDQRPVTQYAPVLTLNGSRVLSLPMMMAAGIADTLEMSSKRYFINYSPVYFPRMSHTALDSALIADRYVFVGGLLDNNDLFNTPLGLKSGMEIHAYTLKTLLENDLVDDSANIAETIIGLLVCIGFCLLLVLIDGRLADSRSQVLRYIGQESLLSLGVAYVVIWLLGFVGYVLFMNGVYLSMSVALTVLLRVVVVAKILYVLAIICIGDYLHVGITMSVYSRHKKEHKEGKTEQR